MFQLFEGNLKARSFESNAVEICHLSTKFGGHSQNSILPQKCSCIRTILTPGRLLSGLSITRTRLFRRASMMHWTQHEIELLGPHVSTYCPVCFAGLTTPQSHIPYKSDSWRHSAQIRALKSTQSGLLSPKTRITVVRRWFTLRR